jgi:DNA replication and repair protein RecF
MKIIHIQLHNFRNHESTELDFGEKINVVAGDNGQGKTNLLEGISFLCLTKSFYAGSDAIAVQDGKDILSLRGTFVSDPSIEFHNYLAYDKRLNKKEFYINNKQVETFSSVIGRFPLVVLSPENSPITFGTPADRRKFTDLVISQSSSSYMEEMLEYRKTVRQRNKILSEALYAKEGIQTTRKRTEPWNETLVSHGARIMARRAQFFKEFSSYLLAAYLMLVGEAETPRVLYQPNIPSGSEDSVEKLEDLFRAVIEKKSDEEYRTGTTLVGPHRDEVLFSINDSPLRSHASQGQHKTFLIALKIAEYQYLKERCRELPLFLFDDVFSELDNNRSRRLAAIFDSLGQVFITTTDEDLLHETGTWGSARRKILVRNGAAITAEVEA